MQKYLTPETQIEVAGQIATRDVRAEIHEQHLYLRAHHGQYPNVIELSEDSYLVLYLQVRDMMEVMGSPIPTDIQTYEGLAVRRVSGQGVILVLCETTEPHLTRYGDAP